MTNSAGHLTPWLCILQQIPETEVTYKSQKSHGGFFTLPKKHLRYSETPKELLIMHSLVQMQTQLKNRTQKGIATEK